MATCPNINLPEWKILVDARGENMAYALWDKYDGNVPKSEYDISPNKVSYSLKSVNILLSEKAKQIFSKAKNVGWDLNKTLTELQIPKDQKVYIQEVYDNISYVNPETNKLIEPSIEDLVTSILANNSFTVEVNTAKGKYTNNKKITPLEPLPEDFIIFDNTEEEFINAGIKYKVEESDGEPTQYYANLTVPGGTNYTENEITTPDITPNIKGHAQFSTDQGIGWFRSDETSPYSNTLGLNVDAMTGEEYDNYLKNYPKTRRILEVQSDLFQKGRKKNDLTTMPAKRVTGYKVGDQVEVIPPYNYDPETGENVEIRVKGIVLEVTEEIEPEFLPDENQMEPGYPGLVTIKMSDGKIRTFRTDDDSVSIKPISIKEEKESKENNFLQLLNKKGNWVNFFIQSIVQDSAKKGYEKVLFPTGETAAKVEGHETLAIELTKINKRIEAMESTTRTDSSGYSYHTDLDGTTVGQGVLKDLIKRKEDLKTQGLEKLKPIEAFYSNRVTNILNKLYNVNKIRDEYGNTWSEVTILPEILQQSILLQRKTTVAKKASPEVLSKVKKVIKKMGVDVQSLSEYAKQNPAVDVSSANALADLTAGIIAVSEGNEDVALTEEMVHIATAIIEQRDPKLVTEMISKIGRFQIYKDTLAEYKDSKAYQLPNGKPNIRKIKKEAVDKMIAAVITNDPNINLEEVDQSLFRRMWNTITDWFRGQYKKANIDIFSKTAETVLGGEFEGSILDLNSTEIYYQLSDAQKDFQQKIEETKSSLRKIETNEKTDPLLADEEKATSYYELLVDGEYVRVTKRVTDRVKRWYKNKLGDKRFTAQEDKDNEVKRLLGTKYHDFFEKDIHDRFFNSDGTRRVNPGPKPTFSNSVDSQVYDKLETYYTDLIASFSENGKNPLVFTELQIYDKKEKEAGTIDLLIVEEDGTANIYDWKFMSIYKGAEDVAWFKQGAYDIQLRRYKEILVDNYGISTISKNRAIPIIMDLKRANPKDQKSNLEIKGIKIGSVDPGKIDPLTLTPVSEKTEITGVEVIDDVLSQLSAVQKSLEEKSTKTDDEYEFKIERVNLIKKAVRSLRGNQNLGPLVDTIAIMEREGTNILSEYITSYEGRPANDKDLDDVTLSEFSASMMEYIGSAEIFGTLADELGDLIYTKEMEVEAITEEDKDNLASRKELVQKLKDQQESIRRSRRKIEKLSGEFTSKFIGERNLVTGLMNPEKVVTGLKSLFRGLSDIGLAATTLLYKMANSAMGKANAESLKETNELLDIRDRLKARGGNLKDIVSKIYQRDKKDSIVNKLIYQYEAEYYSELKANSEEGARSKKWLKDNVNLPAYYKEAKPILDRSIARIKKNNPEGERREKLVLEANRMWDVLRTDFNGWGNFVLKRHPQEKWQSKEYLDIKKDPELLELYNFITKLNVKAQGIGYINNAVRSTFLPFVRKSMAESIAWDGSLPPLSRFKERLQNKADDVGYGSINEVTNELENSIPKYYVTDFSIQEDGPNDYSDVSLDIFKNLLLYTNHMNKYKYLTEIEDQLLLAKTVQQFKKNIKTGRFGGAIKENGRLVLEAGSKKNLEIIDQFFRATLYGQKYASDDSDIGFNLSKVTDIINKAVGRDIVSRTDNIYSIQKTMDALNRYTQARSLGFEFISGSVNAFGGNVQLSALAGKYFKYREVLKYEHKLIGNKWVNNDERTMFLELLDTFMPLKEEPTYEKFKKAGLTKWTQLAADENFSDSLFFFFRQPELHIEKSVFMALLDNMMVEDGKLVNIRDFVKKKYKARYESSEKFKELNPKIEEEIKELQKTRSINSIKKLENGKLVVPGLDLSNRKELQRLTNVARTIARTATGGMTDFDNMRVNMNIWLRSLMVFKGWIPKLFDTRFSEFRKVADDFNVEIDENGITTGERYEIGRVRLWGGMLLESIAAKSNLIQDIIKGSDKGILKIDELYVRYTKQYFKENGVQANITKEDFADLIQTNLYNQRKELLILLNMLALSFAIGAIAPDDDEDRAKKNQFRYFQKVIDKFISELGFFYNPVEMASTLDSGMPLLGTVTQVGKFATHLMKEISGFDISNPDRSIKEVRKRAQPTKNLMKMFPLSKSFVNYLAMFDEEWAKAMDVTIPKRNR